MKTLYLECNMGAAGDMLTAALLDLFPPERQQEFLRVMNAIPGVTVTAEPSQKCGVQGLHVTVIANGQEERSEDVLQGQAAPHDHGHSHECPHGHGYTESPTPECGREAEHTHRHAPAQNGHSHEHAHHHADMAGIESIIDSLPLPGPVKAKAKLVYSLIAQAESHAHGCPVSQVHFHEVGALDAVADVAGVCLLLHWLAPDQIVVSPVRLGSGQVRCAHGILPVPAPATAFLLQGVPSYGGTIQGELCTPTGAALIKAFATGFGPQPVMTVRAVGVGVGSKEFAAANILRAFAGESEPMQNNDEVTELRCNLDDMTGEAVGYACERLLEAGALDVYTVPIQMKKGRPAVMLCCLCRPDQQARLIELILAHTTSWGVRACSMQRAVLPTETKTVSTAYGPVRIKCGSGWGQCKAKVEYADAAAAAKAVDVPLEQVCRAAFAAIEKRSKPE